MLIEIYSVRFLFSRGLDGGFLDGRGRTRRWNEEVFWSTGNVLVLVLGAGYPGVSPLTSCMLMICVYLGVLSFS